MSGVSRSSKFLLDTHTFSHLVAGDIMYERGYSNVRILTIATSHNSTVFFSCTYIMLHFAQVCVLNCTSISILVPKTSSSIVYCCL